jgi:hypothetical protein
MGQTEITGYCDGLMCKNGEQNIIDFACVESHQLFVHGKSSSFAYLDQYALETVGLLWSMCGYGAYGVSASTNSTFGQRNVNLSRPE